LRNDSRHDLQERQSALVSGSQRVDQANALGDFAQEPHGADTRPLNLLDVTEAPQRLQVALVFESQLECLDLFRGTPGQVGDGRMADFAVLPKGGSEQVARVGLVATAEGGGVDVNSVYSLSAIALYSCEMC
jgi:hypothetical protein